MSCIILCCSIVLVGTVYGLIFSSLECSEVSVMSLGSYYYCNTGVDRPLMIVRIMREDPDRRLLDDGGFGDASIHSRSTCRLPRK
jgi:hypothetical protein